MAKHSRWPPPEPRLHFTLRGKKNPNNMRTPGRRAPLAFSTAEAERLVEGPGYRLISDRGSYDREHSGRFMNEESSLPDCRQQTVSAQWPPLSG